ncbi:coiled-coil domain-containing protein 137-like [Lycorma delicatula]|uniref:coiled-coil domain-containing protein 137-like n=1 Tax=Lycorma delicatula TaxID=130591 RepID=UPI003F512862
MGRKIPGRKHKGVKDPVIQKAVREQKLKTKINAPPTDPNEQETPKSLENLIRLKQIAKNTQFKKKKRSRNKLVDTSKFNRREFRLPGMKKPDKTLPSLNQWQGETDETFLKRIDEATQNLINEVEFEEQFGVRVRHNSETGDVEEIEMAERDEIDLLMRNYNKEKKDNYKNKKKEKMLKKFQKNTKDVNSIGDASDNIALNSKQRRKMKALQKKQESVLENGEKIQFHDVIKFGEVVHQPPQITVRPKNANKIKKPGAKGDLLLEKMLGNNNKKNKYSSISPLQRQKQEQERNHIVELYRKIKSQNKRKLNIAL